MQLLRLRGWQHHRLGGDHALGEAALGNPLQSSFTNESVILGIADEVRCDLRWASVERVGADEYPRMTKGGAERLIETTLDDPPTASCDGNQWWQDALEHDSRGEFVVAGTSDYQGEATVPFEINGFVTKTASLEHLIKLGEGAARKTPFIDMTNHARLGGQCGPFGNELLDQG